MRLNEIETKYIRLEDCTVNLLEAYKNPDTELTIKFDLLDKEFSDIYYKGIVSEINTGDKILLINFSLDSKNPNSVSVDNIHPSPNKVAKHKIVHTTAGSQATAVDMGHTAMKWVFNKIKEFSTSLGFDIKHIKSTSRYTGARAKNNPTTDGSTRDFNVNVKLREYYEYNCSTQQLTQIKSYSKI